MEKAVALTRKTVEIIAPDGAAEDGWQQDENTVAVLAVFAR